MDSACPPTTDDHIRELVDQAPPLSIRQQEHLKLIFAAAFRDADQTEAA